MSVVDRPSTIDAAKGRWPSILPMLGIDARHLDGKNRPCPMCGGKDRFMFDNTDGSGSWICRQGCGSGYGMSLVEAFKGWNFATAAKEVDGLVGNAPVTKGGRPPMADADRRDALNRLWQASNPVQENDAVDDYLSGRGLAMPYWPNSLRCIPECGVKGHPTKTRLPAMLARVVDLEGLPVTIQRTYLDGAKKAVMNEGEMATKLMPGTLPDAGICVRLSEVKPHIGIAEGIETAMAASLLFGVPVWATLTAGLLKKWRPPEGVEVVSIFGDNDASFTGHAAAHLLANRITCNAKIKARVDRVLFPERPGEDWLDVLNNRKATAA